MFDVVGDVEEAVEKLLASEQMIDVARIARVLNRVQFAFVRAAGEFERSEAWVADGYVKAASAIRVKCGMTQGAANATLTLAKKLTSLPVVAGAFEAGEISRAHADVITRAHTAERAIAVEELQQPLVDAAKVATPKELAQIVQRVCDAIDGDEGSGGAQARRDRRRLHISKTIDGMVMGDFLLDAEDGETVLRAVEAMRGRYRSTETRTPAQQRADALVELCRVGVAHAEDGPGPLHADIAVHVDIADIERRGGTELADEIRAGAGGLPKATLRRLTCDARISRVITSGPSQVLDVGRATRTISKPLRRALEARDRGCAWPGCDRPASWTQAHHIKHWADDGETSLANTISLCTGHHWLVHEGGHDPPPVPT